MLLVSPALAQVHGPGPSPASDFDTVVNLPSLEFSEDDFLVIAGVDGETFQLNINHDGAVTNEAEVRSGGEVNIIGGAVGARFIARSGSEVNMSSGSVGTSFQASDGSLVNISGGVVGASLECNAGSEVNLSGGDFGDIVARGTVSISGGNVGSIIQTFSDSEVTISGGTRESGLLVRAGSQINIIGSEFFVDGEELDSLVLGEAFTITDRNVTLSGVLADGQPFSFELNPDFSASGFFSPNATLTVTLEEAVLLLGDVNRDGVVDFFDIQPFIEVLANEGTQAEADIDQNGVVNFFDIQPFIEILASN